MFSHSGGLVLIILTATTCFILSLMLVFMTVIVLKAKYILLTFLDGIFEAFLQLAQVVHLYTLRRGLNLLNMFPDEAF